MKKVSTNTPTDSDTMQAEYDFTGGIRGKHYRAMQAGYTITMNQPDGTKGNPERAESSWRLMCGNIFPIQNK